MKKGFTLVELLAVIVLLGLVSVAAFLSITAVLDKSKERMKKVSANSILNTAAAYYTQNGIDDDTCISVQDLIDAGMLEDGTLNPRTGDNTWSESDKKNKNICPVSKEGEKDYTRGGYTYIVEKSDDEKITKGYSVGDKFCLNENKECFYVISDNGNTVTALSEWNLNVGDNKNPNVVDGVQDESVKGYVRGQTKYGHVIFSDNNYWQDSNKDDEKGFVFDLNSNLYSYVQNYQLYLRNTLNKKSVTATLLNYEQILSLGCSTNKCVNEPSWLRTTSYWSGVAYSYSSNKILAFSPILPFAATVEYDSISGYGVRPVITISKTEL